MTTLDKAGLEAAVETALRAAYARGFEWGRENPNANANEFLPKAAADYADKVLSDRDGPLASALAASPPAPGAEPVAEDERQFALTGAAQAFCNRGITIACPWEGDLDDEERERFKALVAAIDTYNALAHPVPPVRAKPWITTRNELAKFTEFVSEDVPVVVRTMHAGVDLLLDMNDRERIVGYRVYDLIGDWEREGAGRRALSEQKE